MEMQLEHASKETTLANQFRKQYKEELDGYKSQVACSTFY